MYCIGPNSNGFFWLPFFNNDELANKVVCYDIEHCPVANHVYFKSEFDVAALATAVIFFLKLEKIENFANLLCVARVFQACCEVVNMKNVGLEIVLPIR